MLTDRAHLSLAPSPACLPGPAEETQQCADAATEHVRFLEEKAEADGKEHEAALAALQQELDGARCVLWGGCCCTAGRAVGAGVGVCCRRGQKEGWSQHG